MDWKKIAPWNWFREEESAPPAARVAARGGAAAEPFGALRTEMERLFDDVFRRSFAGMREGAVPEVPALLRPNVDISEGKKAYTVRAELPGMELGDLSIEVDDHTLEIRGEKRRESSEEDEGYHWVERSYGTVQRVLSLPEDADCEAIDAKFRNGVLKLHIPKHPARASRARPIEVHAG